MKLLLSKGALDQTKDSEAAKRTNFLKNTQLFSIEPKSGLIYYNHHVRDLWLNNQLFQHTSFFNNNFFILRIKVKDNGFSMVDSSNSFTLKLRLCFREQDSSVSSAVKYCDSSYFEDESSKSGDPQKIVLQRLENIDEELKVYDYAVIDSRGGSSNGLKDEYDEYMAESAEDNYDAEAVDNNRESGTFTKYTMSQTNGQQKKNKTRVNKTLISDLFGYSMSGSSASSAFYPMMLPLFCSILSVLIRVWDFKLFEF